MSSPRSLDTVEIITIGTELLLGFTVDTNAAFLGQTLSAAGVRVAERTTVRDAAADIRSAVERALDRTGFVVTTGGLGPTRDDISRDVIATLFDMPLTFDPVVWDAVLARYARRGAVPSESNRTQAMIPRGAIVLPNQWGTAPGLWLESARGVVVMLPGVPLEMRNLLVHEALPRVTPRTGGTVIRSATLRTNGVPESTLADRIGDLEDRLAPLSLAYLPGTTGVDLRLTAWQLPAAQADALLDRGMAELRRIAPDCMYGEGDADLATAVLERLRQGAHHLAVAESCTGGMLGARLTDIAGASDVFLGGAISYANAVKIDLLDVPAAVIAEHGAVSAESASAMVQGVASRLGADVAVAITGIAGPGGGTPEKPVGTVWFAFLVHGRVETHRSVFGGNRSEIRERAVLGALMGLWKRLS
ncbi:MAG TPA: competence/damage-inducible protein A [Gemmatimonadales bacterium]|jgi:nicotinamide-nucleotide amidase|nr:competence/damage-inducible protein A [Gemmatimonadales bacterium]